MDLSVTPLRLAVLVSGSGTNLQALLDRSAGGELSGRVVVVAGDNPDAYGLVRAQRAHVPTHVVNYDSHLRPHADREDDADLPVDLDELDRAQKILKSPDRRKRLERLRRLVLAEQELIRALDAYRPDYVCLAGYMRLVTPYFLGHYNQGDDRRVLNIHPALLPAFPGTHGYEDTWSYGCKWGGITVHFVDEGEDSGPILAQAVYPVWPQDDLEKIRRRGLQLEYEMYAQCINWLAAGQVKLHQEPGHRARASIVDPMYPAVLKKWMQRALA